MLSNIVKPIELFCKISKEFSQAGSGLDLAEREVSSDTFGGEAFTGDTFGEFDLDLDLDLGFGSGANLSLLAVIIVNHSDRHQYCYL